MAKRPQPIVLTVLDGWGYRAETRGNAIALARKPAYDELIRNFPNTLIHPSGPFVGLPEGQMGNSEVGHLNIGAGRIVHMDITRVDQLIASGAFFRQPLLLQAMERGRQRQLHLLGLLSDGGVHSHIQHLFALLRMARENQVERVFVHCFLDGRDTPPTSGADFLRQLRQKLREFGRGQIATVIGRYYAMDRDNRWERIEKAYRAMVHGEAEGKTADPVEAVTRSYEQGVTDEFVKPIVITGSAGAPGKPDLPACLIRDEDGVIFYNFRADRARQTTRALAEPGFRQFADAKRPKNLFFVAMTQYEKTWPWLHYLIGSEKLEHILAQVFAERGYKNLRCAETEKYAHVTYFFNGGVEKIGHVRVFLRLRAAQILVAALGKHLRENVLELFRADEVMQPRPRFFVLRHSYKEKILGPLGVAELAEAGFGEGARGLPRAVGAKIVEDHRIVIPDQTDGQLCFSRGTGRAGNHDGFDELIGDAVFVAACDRLERVGGLALRFAVNHRAIGLFDALPAVVAVHGIVAPDDRRNLPAAEFAKLLLQLTQKIRAARGRSVAPVQEAMHKDALDLVLARNAEQREHMLDVRVHAAITQQAQQVQLPLAPSLHSLEKQRLPEERAAGDELVHARDVHVDDTARADIEVAHFAVAHLSFGQADEGA